VTGPFDKQLVELLPQSLKYICHNGTLAMADPTYLGLTHSTL